MSLKKWQFGVEGTDGEIYNISGSTGDVEIIKTMIQKMLSGLEVAPAIRTVDIKTEEIVSNVEIKSNNEIPTIRAVKLHKSFNKTTKKHYYQYCAYLPIEIANKCKQNGYKLNIEILFNGSVIAVGTLPTHSVKGKIISGNRNFTFTADQNGRLKYPQRKFEQYSLYSSKGRIFFNGEEHLVA